MSFDGAHHAEAQWEFEKMNELIKANTITLLQHSDELHTHHSRLSTQAELQKSRIIMAVQDLPRLLQDTITSQSLVWAS